MTAKSIYKKLERFASINQFIQSIDSGTTFEFNEENKDLYPQIFFENDCQFVNIDRTNLQRCIFYVSFCDLIQSDANQDLRMNTLDKMLLVSKQCENWLKDVFIFNDIEFKCVGAIPFIETESDKITGYRVQFETIGLTLNDCDYGD